MTSLPPDAENPSDRNVARMFHEAYERLAPAFGYRTRDASAVPWEKVPARNRDLMTATVGEVRGALFAAGRAAAHPDPPGTWECCGVTFSGTPDFISGARAAHVCPPEDVPDAETAYAMGKAAAASPDPPREEWRVVDGDNVVCRVAGHRDFGTFRPWAEEQCRGLVERFPGESFRIERRVGDGEWEAWCPPDTPMGSCVPRCGDPRCEAAATSGPPAGPIPGPDPGACPRCGEWRKAGMIHRCTPAASPDERLREALTRIERLVARWDAPIRHDVDDRVAYEKWAAVGSEAHKIAADALAAADRDKPDGTTPTFCCRPDCGLRATRIAPDPDGVRWRPYCSDCSLPVSLVPKEPSDD